MRSIGRRRSDLPEQGLRVGLREVERLQRGALGQCGLRQPRHCLLMEGGVVR